MDMNLPTVHVGTVHSLCKCNFLSVWIYGPLPVDHHKFLPVLWMRSYLTDRIVQTISLHTSVKLTDKMTWVSNLRTSAFGLWEGKSAYGIVKDRVMRQLNCK